MLNTARIAKNTIFLYLRMILVLAANFLAVRVLLEVLGVDDYGLFNLIVGFGTLFTLPWHAEAFGEGRLNGAMTSTVRSRRKTCFEGSRQAERFLFFELGRATSTMSPPVDAIVSIASDRKSNNSTVHLFSPPTFPLLRSLSGFFSWSILSAVANTFDFIVSNFQQAFNPNCRVPLLICRERNVLTRNARHFFFAMNSPTTCGRIAYLIGN